MAPPRPEPNPMHSQPGGRPRDAASLVITEGRGRSSRVLLGRREPRDRFLPDLYVFPGGRVDPDDASRPSASELRAEVAQRMVSHGSPRRCRALAVACVRETHEETGLVLGEIIDGQLHPALGQLDYVARAITPAGNPIRYHARFFSATAEFVSGSLLSNGELLDLGWRSFDESLALPMLDVTKFVLQTIALRLDHPSGAELPERARTQTALIHYRRDECLIRYE